MKLFVGDNPETDLPPLPFLPGYPTFRLFSRCSEGTTFLNYCQDADLPRRWTGDLMTTPGGYYGSFDPLVNVVWFSGNGTLRVNQGLGPFPASNPLMVAVNIQARTCIYRHFEPGEASVETITRRVVF